MTQVFIFLIVAAIAILSAAFMLYSKNAVHSAMFLVLNFACVAFFFLTLSAPFIALMQIAVYAGAIMVLFLFVVMMLDIDMATLRAGFINYLPVAVLVAVVMAVEIFLVVGPGNFGLDVFAPPPPMPADYSNTASLGNVLYTVYMYPFEIAAVILLVAIIAAIGLTMRKRADTKYQNPSEQVRIKKGPDRIQVVQMDTED